MVRPFETVGMNGSVDYDPAALAALVAQLRKRHKTAQDLALAALREAIHEGVLAGVG